jgi:hypothetical protein
MLSSFPSLCEAEFRDGCKALQKRCDGRLEDTDWLNIKWQPGVLNIKKSYHINSLEHLDDDTKADEPDDSAVYLEEADREDDV